MYLRQRTEWLGLVLFAGMSLAIGCAGKEAGNVETARDADSAATTPAPVPPDVPAVPPTAEPSSAPPSGGEPAEPGVPDVIVPPIRQAVPDVGLAPSLPELPPVEPPPGPGEPLSEPAEFSVPEVPAPPQPAVVLPDVAQMEPLGGLQPDQRPLSALPPIELPETSNPLRSFSMGVSTKTARPEDSLPRTTAERPAPLALQAAPMAIREPVGLPPLEPAPLPSGGMEVRGDFSIAAAAPPPPPAEPLPGADGPAMVMSKGGPLEFGPPPLTDEVIVESPPPPGPPPLEPAARLPLSDGEPLEAGGPAVPASSPLPELPVTSTEELPDLAGPAPKPAIADPGAGSSPPAARDVSPAVLREEGDYAVVEVFYATDRAPSDAADRPVYLAWLVWTGFSAGLTLVLLAVALRASSAWLAKGLAAVGVAATVVLGLLSGYAALYDVVPGWKVEKPKLAYGGERGKGVELGACEVSIPKQHEVGVLEGPSLFRLELRESPEKHVVLLEVERMPDDRFYTRLGERIGRSPEKDTFVFIHGYNVSFEDAARRTAQIAYDLEFPGAPIMYSWPSQSSVTGYTIDENNVEWTVPHLREFLTALADRSGAEKIHLVAHSMGNRALANALRGLSYRPGAEQPMFNHVVLTAPDVDADVFRRDLAPRIVKTAERVTLYASSKDTALAYSKTVHGYPRAGDTGEDLVVVEGIDTIDVSAVDTSLFSLGHLYYGSSQTVLRDLFDLIRQAKPPEARKWLRPELLGSLTYWVFERIEAAKAAAAVPR